MSVNKCDLHEEKNKTHLNNERDVRIPPWALCLEDCGPSASRRRYKLTGALLLEQSEVGTGGQADHWSQNWCYGHLWVLNEHLSDHICICSWSPQVFLSFNVNCPLNILNIVCCVTNIMCVILNFDSPESFQSASCCCSSNRLPAHFKFNQTSVQQHIYNQHTHRQHWWLYFSFIVLRNQHQWKIN